MEPDNPPRRGRNHRSRHKTRQRGGPAPSSATPADPFAPRQPPAADSFTTAKPGDPFASKPSKSQLAFASFDKPPKKSAFGAFGDSQSPAFSASESQGGFASTAEQSAFGTGSTQQAGFGAPASQPAEFGTSGSQPPALDPWTSEEMFGPPKTQPSDFGPVEQPTGFGDPVSHPSGFGASTSQPKPSQGGAAADPFAPRQSFGSSQAPDAFGTAAEGDPFAPKAPRPPSGLPAGSRPLSTKIMMTKVPQWMFSRDAVLAHFRKLPDVNPLDVTIRGSAKTKEAKRTAVISFATPEEATIAMKRARYYSANMLQLVYFKEGPHSGLQPSSQPDVEPMESQYAPRPPPPPSPMSNELLFSYVPEELFSEEAVRHLFNSISGNQVVSVSIRARPLRGSVKRTAIIKFPDIGGAKTALEMLPLYKGQQLQVTYRNKPPHLMKSQHRAAAGPSLTGRSSDDMSVMLSSAGPSPVQDAAMESSEDGRAFPKAEFVQAKEETKPWGQPFDYDDAKAYSSEVEAGVPSEWPGDAVDEASYPKEDARELEKEQLRKMIAERERLNALRGHGARKKEDTKSRQKAEKGRGRKDAHASKQVVREESNNGGAWRNVGEKVDLNDAVQFVGTCQTMCPEKEISERILQRDISLFETVDGQGGDPDPSKAVKKYRRSAAISELPQPEDVRPPPVLVRTMEYLKGVCDRTDAEFVDIHNFVRDRTRSLRQDFTFQGVRDDSCIKIHEESVRFHIMSEHLLTRSDPAKFSSKQNREQLDKCLISLREMYDLRREEGLPTSPNEPEMQAYYMLTQMSKPETCVQLCTGFAVDVWRSLPVQFALQVVKAASPSFGNYFAYFACVRTAPYLMACLMHSRFTRIRCQALAVINSTHGNAGSPDIIELPSLTWQLGFEDDEETLHFCSLLGISFATVNASESGDRAKSISVPSPDFDIDNGTKWVTKRSDVLIESKSSGLKPSEIISGTGATQFDLSQLPYVSSRHLKRMQLKQNEKPAEPLLMAPSVLPGPSAGMEQERGEVSKVPSRRESAKPPILARLGTVPVKPPAFAAERAPESVSFPPASRDASKEGVTELTKANDEPQLSVPEKTPKKPILKPAVTLPGLNRTPFSLFPGRVVPISDAQEKPMAKKVTFDLGASGRVYPGPDKVTFSTPSESKARKPSENSQQDSAGGEVIRPLATAQALPGEDLSEAAMMKRDAELAKLKREAEAVRLKKLAEEAMLRHQEEVSSARKQSNKDRSNVEAYKEFERLIEKNAEKSQVLKGRMLEIHQRFRSLAFEEHEPPSVLQMCEEAGRALQMISDKLRHCIREMEGANPVTELGSSAKQELIRNMRAIGSFGEKVWKQVWSVKGLAIVSPNGMHGRAPQVTTAKSREGNRSLLVKRKASDENEDVRDERDRAISAARSAAVRKASKIARTERSRIRSELDCVVHEMKRAGLVRWQAAIMDNPGNRTKAESRLHNWVKKRLGEESRQQRDVLRLLSKADSYRAVHLSVREIRPGLRIPPTANVIIFSVDFSSTATFEERCNWIEDSVSKRKDSAVLTGSVAPVLIVLYEGKPGSHPGRVGLKAEEMISRMSSLVGRGLITEYHIVDVSITCSEFIEPNQKFSSALAKTVAQAQEAMEADALELHACSMGDYLVQVGNSAWIRFVSTHDRNENNELWYNEVIDSVNAAWSAVARTIGEEERRWPEELATERKRLAGMKVALRRKMRLPLPSEVNVTSSKDYVVELAKRAGVACPALRHAGIKPLSQFCRALGHLLMPYVSSVLVEEYFTVIYLPRTSLPSSNAAVYYKLGYRLANVGTKEISPSPAVERTWDGTPLRTEQTSDPVSGKSHYSFGLTGTEPGLEKSSLRREIPALPSRRRSLDLLSRTLDFSPPSKKRRNSLPTPREKARKMFSVYDEMCKTEEEHARLLDDNISMLLNLTNSSAV